MKTLRQMEENLDFFLNSLWSDYRSLTPDELADREKKLGLGLDIYYEKQLGFINESKKDGTFIPGGPIVIPLIPETPKPTLINMIFGILGFYSLFIIFGIMFYVCFGNKSKPEEPNIDFLRKNVVITQSE